MEQNLSLYYVFHTVAKKGSISHAAKELYISQPAISKSIQKLEDNLNTTLFKRSSRGVTLTADGEILFQHTRDAFDTLEEGEEILARHHALGVDQLRIGVSTTLCKYILLPHLQRFIKAYPHVKISISCQSTYQTLTLLEENKIDIGLVGEPAIQKGFYFQPLQKIQDIFVTTTAYLEHLELRSGNGDLFQTATFMMLDEKNITRQYINRVFLEHGVFQYSGSFNNGSSDRICKDWNGCRLCDSGICSGRAGSRGSDHSSTGTYIFSKTNRIRLP